MSELAVFVSRSCVLLGFFMLANSVVMLGLMMMMSGRPEANVTGVAFNNTILGPKRLDLMRQLLPGGTARTSPSEMPPTLWSGMERP